MKQKQHSFLPFTYKDMSIEDDLHVDYFDCEISEDTFSYSCGEKFHWIEVDYLSGSIELHRHEDDMGSCFSGFLVGGFVGQVNKVEQYPEL